MTSIRKYAAYGYGLLAYVLLRINANSGWISSNRDPLVIPWSSVSHLINDGPGTPSSTDQQRANTGSHREQYILSSVSDKYDGDSSHPLGRSPVEQPNGEHCHDDTPGKGVESLSKRV